MLSSCNENSKSSYLPEASCAYVNSETFCNFIGNEGKGFSLLHINARSLPKNYDTMYNFLTGINYSFSIIAVSETWVSDNEIKSLYNIPGYNFVCKGRDSRRGGGVGLYLKDGMNYSVRNDFENTQHCESLFIEVKHAYEKNTIVGVIYRPPDGNVGDFNDELQVILDRISREGKWGFLAGDFNIDLLSHVSSSFKDNFENLLSSHCFYPTITYPT